MDQLSFSHQPNEKLFFLGALAGLGKMGADVGIASALQLKKAIIPKPKIPLKISIDDIIIGNN